MLRRLFRYSVIPLALGACQGEHAATPGSSAIAAPPASADAGSVPAANAPSIPPSPPDGSAPAALKAVLVKQFPHDPTAYTQGLEVMGDTLYESTGLEGQSSLRKAQLTSGTILQRAELSPKYFGEGITVFRGKIYQLTWKSHLGFIYDAATLKQIGTFGYDGEGWGLTHDSSSLFMSDGTSALRILDPKTLRVTRTISVTDGGRAVDRLNELEWVKGEIFANVWQTDQIARIDPASGKVRGWIDLAALRPSSLYADTVDVLNGIAYDSTADRLLVTGKLWPSIFQVRLTTQP